MQTSWGSLSLVYECAKHLYQSFFCVSRSYARGAYAAAVPLLALVRRTLAQYAARIICVWLRLDRNAQDTVLQRNASFPEIRVTLPLCNAAHF